MSWHLTWPDCQLPGVSNSGITLIPRSLASSMMAATSRDLYMCLSEKAPILLQVKNASF